MMREIKFRAWKKTNTPEMLNDVTSVDFKKGVVGLGYKVSSWTIREDSEPLENLILMQYTGLKDKNGVEIYEGDIVRYSQTTINGSTFTHVCQVFQHESGTWRIEGQHEDDSRYKTKGTAYGVHMICEVIGNRFENPELLEG